MILASRAPFLAAVLLVACRSSVATESHTTIDSDAAPDAAVGDAGAEDATVASDGGGDDALVPDVGSAPDASDADAASGVFKDAALDSAVQSDVGALPALRRWIMGYYAGYEAGTISPEALDFRYLTHLIVSRIVPTANGVETTFDMGAAGPDIATRVIARAHAQGKKALLMVGGAGAADAYRAHTTPATVGPLVTQLLAACDTFHCDGLDLDWEPVATADEPQLVDLAARLRAARPSLLLTVPVANDHAFTAATVAALSPLVDRLSIMSYHMAGAWPGWGVWHTSALDGATATTPLTVKRAVERWQAAGAKLEQLGLGVGAFGSCWSASAPLQPLQPIGDAQVIGSDGVYSYRKVTTMVPLGTRHWDATAHAPYVTFDPPLADGCRYLSYEDPQSVKDKSDYARALGIGTMILWTAAEGQTGGPLPAPVETPLAKAVCESFYGDCTVSPMP